MFVDRDPQRAEGFEVHQQVVDHHARIAEAVDQLVGQHHAVHPPERVVRCEKITAFGIEFFEPFDRIGHLPFAETGADELLRRQVPVMLEDVIDFRLMDRTAEPAEDEPGNPAGQPRGFLGEYRSDIYSGHRDVQKIISANIGIVFRKIPNFTPKSTSSATNMSQYHTPVLLEESVGLLGIDPAGTYVDLTFGGGGHSRRILEELGPEGRLYAFDQDRDTLANAPTDGRFHYVESNFRFLRGALRLRGVTEADGILADLGVSSHHFDAVERGFSFRGEAPLDMRMNQRGGLTAAKVVNSYPAQTLTQLLGDWGELDTPWKVANCIVRARETAPIQTTAQLVEAVRPCTPKKDESKFLTKLFQALRIEVNGEMEALKMALEQSLRVLRPGGRLVVISYHSLEDRLVKNFLRSGNFAGAVEKDFYGRALTPFEILTRKAVVPSDEELERNPRSRSAKLRAAVKR